MHDIWNPWHGCKKCSEGCEHCYMYYLDKIHNKNGADIYRTKAGFYYPLQRFQDGRFKVRSGEKIRVCMTSDFFLEEADAFRDEAWDIMWQRPDVVFFLLTKRPERVAECLPADWGDGWKNVFFNVTCENQRRADERIPILLELPFVHKGIFCAPLLGSIHIEQYLQGKQIEQVVCGGENYDGARPCHFEWVQELGAQCRMHNVTFCFMETGTYFVKDAKRYHLKNKRLQSKMAHQSGVSFEGKPIDFILTDCLGLPIPQELLYFPQYRENCQTCGSRLICNGCSACGGCSEVE